MTVNKGLTFDNHIFLILKETKLNLFIQCQFNFGFQSQGKNQKILKKTRRSTTTLTQEGVTLCDQKIKSDKTSSK